MTSTRHASTARVAVAASGAQTGLAHLPDRAAKMSCAALASGTHRIAGLSVQIAEYKQGSAANGDPEYCALSGHIATKHGSNGSAASTTR